MAGFEPTTSSSRTKRATGLRYIPKGNRFTGKRLPPVGQDGQDTDFDGVCLSFAEG